MPEAALLAVIIVLALAYAFANGLNDSANAIATVISTRVMTPGWAILMGAFFNAVGALTGTAVAKTIGKGIVDPAAVSEVTVMSALIGAVAWVFLATRMGLPISVTHSLIGGLIGAGLATGGVAVLVPAGIIRVLLAIAISPVLGLVVGFAVMVGLLWLLRRSSPSLVSGVFGRLQMLSAAFMAYSHGKNDGQNAMGVIALGLAVYYGREARDLSVPVWVIFVSALTMAVGTGWGGWRVIRTLGLRLTKLRPVHGFAAETSAASLIEGASIFGLPVSTTHVISTTIMGVGATTRFSAVRWGVTFWITLAWVVTLPFCAAVAYAAYKLLSRVL